MATHRCVECKEPIPIYQKYYCEKCFEEALKDKVKKD